MKSTGVELEAIDGTVVWINPDFVMMVTPMMSEGAAVLGQCIVHIMGGKFPVKGSCATVAHKIWAAVTIS